MNPIKSESLHTDCTLTCPVCGSFKVVKEVDTNINELGVETHSTRLRCTRCNNSTPMLMGEGTHTILRCLWDTEQKKEMEGNGNSTLILQGRSLFCSLYEIVIKTARIYGAEWRGLEFVCIDNPIIGMLLSSIDINTKYVNMMFNPLKWTGIHEDIECMRGEAIQYAEFVKKDAHTSKDAIDEFFEQVKSLKGDAIRFAEDFRKNRSIPKDMAEGDALDDIKHLINDTLCFTQNFTILKDKFPGVMYRINIG